MKLIVLFLLLSFLFANLLWGIDDFQISEYNFPETFSEQLPSVASNLSGNFVVVWMDEREGDYTIYGQRFTNNGIPIGGNFRINQFTFEENAAPVISMNADGKFVVAWVQGDYIYARVFDEEGNPISSAFKVNDDIGHKHSSPSVALFDNGMFVIVWQDTRNGTWAPDIFAQFYLVDGSPYLENFIVNDHTGGKQGFPAVTILGYDIFTVSWMDSRNGNFDIYAQSFWWNYPMGSNIKVNDDVTDVAQYTPSISESQNFYRVIVWQDYREGFPNIYGARMEYTGLIEANFRINDDVDTVYHGNPSVSTIKSGYIVVWDDERNGDINIHAQIFDSNANPIGSNFQVNTGTDTLSQNFPSVTGDSYGAVVVFQDEEIGEFDVYFQRYDSMGVSQGPNTIVTNNLLGAHQAYPSISVPFKGDFVVIWQDLRKHNWDIFIQRIDSSGSLIGSNTPVNDDLLSNDQILPSIAEDTLGNFVTVWMDSRENNWDIYGEMFDAYGNSIGSNFRINDDTLQNDQFFPDVAKNINGGFIVTWDENSNILARMYDKNGNPLVSSFKVNDDTIPGFTPSIAIFYNRSFIISFAGDGCIYANILDSTGTPIGGNFRVDDDSSLAQKFCPQVEIDISGNFVIAWEDLRNTEPDIYTQRFDSTGNHIGGNLRVNDDGWGTEQYLPSVAISPLGKFVIAWMDERDGNFNVYCQRYLSSGSSYGQNFKVNNDIGLCQQTDVDVSMDNEEKIFFSWTDRRIGVSGTDIFVKIMEFETGVQSGKSPKPGNKALSFKVYPNPFSKKTVFSLQNRVPTDKTGVTLRIYDLSGRLVKSFSLTADNCPLSTDIFWNGRDERHNPVSAGIYFVKLIRGKESITKKMVMLE